MWRSATTQHKLKKPERSGRCINAPIGAPPEPRCCCQPQFDEETAAARGRKLGRLEGKRGGSGRCLSGGGGSRGEPPPPSAGMKIKATPWGGGGGVRPLKRPSHCIQ